MQNDQYLSVKRTRELLGVSSQTLRNWDAEGKIRSARPQPGSGHRMYNKQDVLNITGGPLPAEEKQKVAYCRVSSKKQKDDLDRQKDFFRHNYPGHRVVADIGSGINWKRKGLQTILELSMRGELEELLVNHRDRLCRFAFELVSWILERNGTKLIILNGVQDESENGELADDILSIVHVYSCRQMGRRRYTLQTCPTLS